MSLWAGRLLILGAVFLIVGWGLVLLSGFVGNSTDGSEVVWAIGGLMVYAAFPTFVTAAAVALVGRLRPGAAFRCPRP